MMHLFNLLLATILSDNPESDQCVWYFVSLMADTFIGILICYGFLVLVQKLADKYKLKYLQSGLYYEMVMNKKGKLKPKMKMKMYTAQLTCWLLIVLTVRYGHNSRLNGYSSG
jgi:hypothetical protein